MADWAIIAGTPILAWALCTVALILLLPWLRSHALAHPVARSAHRIPTPQGGGLGIVIAAFVILWLAAIASQILGQTAIELTLLTLAVALLTIVGLIDDLRGLSPTVRLALQFVAVGLILASLSPDMRICAPLPLWLERVVIAVAGVWFINLVNFMDGMDWMTVAEAVPLTAAIALLGLTGTLPRLPTLAALALCGAILGFAPFNRPVAKLFLGDVGSLPIGLVVGWLLLLLAVNGQLASALLLPLYYLADATITLGLRLSRGEPVWQAHRSHFYQRAGAGLTVPNVIARVFATNLALAALAILAATANDTAISLLCLATGGGLVAILLMHFSRVGQSVDRS